MAQALAGIKVLELANFIAGPLCGMLLGDMGTDVIKIEPPDTGDMSRATPPFVNGESANFPRSTGTSAALRSISSAEARDVVLRLAADADVVLENFRPGVMAKMRLGAEQSPRR